MIFARDKLEMCEIELRHGVVRRDTRYSAQLRQLHKAGIALTA